MRLAALTQPRPPPLPAVRTAGSSLEVPIRHCRRCIEVIFASAAVLLGALVPRTAAAQREVPQWVISRDAFADLWYHGLATVGVDSYGPQPLYSAAHVRSVRETKRTRGLVTRLDSSARTLHAAFAGDSAFDALHFVPLYFVGVDPGTALAALRQALGGGPSDSAVPLVIAARAAAVARSVPGARDRRALITFIDALAHEWRAIVRDERAAWRPSPRTLAALQRDWDSKFEPALSRYLTAGDRSRGTIVGVPALGGEGRIVSVRGGLSVVMVSGDSIAGVDDAPLLAAVRELSFALLDNMPANRLTAGFDRAAAERAREIAAVRGGAILLEAVAPTLAPSYQRLYTADEAGRKHRAFEAEYPLEASSVSALRAAAARFSSAHPAQR